MVDDGVTRAVSLVLAPHFSALSVAKYQQKVADGLELSRGRIHFEHVASYHDAPGLVTAFASRVEEGLSRWPVGERERVHVIFSAHSLPQRVLASGDPYGEQCLETARLVAERAALPDERWSWAYQSAGRTPEPWAGPGPRRASRRAGRRWSPRCHLDPGRVRLRPRRDPLRHRPARRRGRRRSRDAARAAAGAERRSGLHRDTRGAGARAGTTLAGGSAGGVKVAVVGGGIAGLAAARRLETVAPDAEIVLIESDVVLGGKLRTEHVDGFVIEAAPDSFLSRKERGVGLVQELGLGEELIARRPEHHHTFVRRGGDLHPLPEGLTGMIPTNLDALERSELLSPEGKVRFASEPDVPTAPGVEDESVAAFISRRFGREAYEALVEPLMTGIYGGDGDQLSLRATFPQLRALELERGSILRGVSAPPPSELPPFVSLRDGMGSLVLRRRRRARTHRAASRTRRSPSGPTPGWLRARARRRRGDRRRRGRHRDSGVRHRRSARGSRPRPRSGTCGDPVRVFRRRHACVLSRGGDSARRLWIPRPARRRRGRARLHVDVAEVGRPRTGGLGADSRVRRTIRRTRSDGGLGREPGRTRS